MSSSDLTRALHALEGLLDAERRAIRAGEFEGLARLATSQLRRVRRIVDAAVALAEKGGFDGVRLRDVAEASGVLAVDADPSLLDGGVGRSELLAVEAERALLGGLITDPGKFGDALVEGEMGWVHVTSVEAMRRCGERAQGRGVTFCIEPLGTPFITWVDDALRARDGPVDRAVAPNRRRLRRVSRRWRPTAVPYRTATASRSGRGVVVGAAASSSQGPTTRSRSRR